MLLVQRRRRAAQVTARYRPLLLLALEQEFATLPPPSRSERIIVLALWRQLHDSLRGKAVQKLNDVALDCGFALLARELLHSRHVGDRLLAITTAGLLRDSSSWAEISEFVRLPHPLLSVASARSLMLIDPDKALSQLMPAFASRLDWPIAAIAAILSEAGPDVITGPLVAAAFKCVRGPDAVLTAPRMLRLLALTHLEEATATARLILESAREEPIIAAGLRLLCAPQDLAQVRFCCTHASPGVRVQAASALGRIGAPEDRALLMRMTTDSNWWVRYRAAQALASMPSVGISELKALQQNATDRFAANILAQVIAEREAA